MIAPENATLSPVPPPEVFRASVVIPAHNHGETLGEVLRAVLAVLPDVVVVDDGSRDKTEEVLLAFPQVHRVRHERTEGYGASLLSGLEKAHEVGCSHAIVMEGDGRHSAADLWKFLRTAQRNPTAVVVGFRRPGAGGRHPVMRAIMRAFSNFWVWVAAGRMIRDSQSAFRCYPVAPLLELVYRTRGHEFATELAIKGAWLGLPFRAVPVASPPLRRPDARFAVLRDSWRWWCLIWLLIWQRVLFPRPLLGAIHRKEFEDLRPLQRARVYTKGIVLQETTTAARFAMAVAVGVFFAIVPLWGIQMVLALALGHYMGLSKPLIILACNVSWGLLLPVILVGSLALGQYIMDGSVEIVTSPSMVTMALIKEYLLEYLIGGTVLAFIVGGVFGIASWGAALWFMGGGEMGGE